MFHVVTVSRCGNNCVVNMETKDGFGKRLDGSEQLLTLFKRLGHTESVGVWRKSLNGEE